MARTEKEKQEAIKRLAYEIKMLVRTASSLDRLPDYERAWIVHNSLIHSFLLAVRNLLEFLFRGQDNKDDTIYAKTFIPSWQCQSPDFTEGIHWSKVDSEKNVPNKTLYKLVCQRLQHITWASIDESKLDWHEPEIAREFLEPILQFQLDLATELQTEEFKECVDEFKETCKRFGQAQEIATTQSDSQQER